MLQRCKVQGYNQHPIVDYSPLHTNNSINYLLYILLLLLHLCDLFIVIVVMLRLV